MVLERINYPKDLKKLSLSELELLAKEIREFLIERVSKTGGHLASNLGVVELTIALHYVFDTPVDKIIWDVGHQCYVHKILTGRKERFDTLRQYGGLSGFPKPDESEFDTYIVGHASTSLSLTAGEAVARDFKKENYNIIAVIGDGALTGGIAFEGLNNLGQLQKNVIVILNTNEMSIAPNVGAIAGYLNRIITESFYNRIKVKIEKILLAFPEIGKKLYNFKNKITELIKAFFMPGILFEELGFMYVGPEDGHNLRALIRTLQRLKKLKTRPILYHIVTVKGKGYKYAEEKPEKFHGISSFDVITGNSAAKERLSYTEVFGRTILQLAKKDRKIVAITAAMPDGTGLNLFKSKFPERFFDVGIAEQHAVTFAAALAARGFKPVLAIYSTFMQRAFDQLIHDIAIAKLDVKFFVDRAGIVGEDGETHHGIFDLPYLRLIPNVTILSPKNGEEFRNMIWTSINYIKGPVFVRYPRDLIPEKRIDINKKFKKIDINRIEILRRGKDIAIIATGTMVKEALRLANMLGDNKCLVLNVRAIKPLNSSQLIKYVQNVKIIVIIEENNKRGGMNEEIIRILNENKIFKKIKVFALPDTFIEHGGIEVLREKYCLKAERIYEILKKEYVF